MIKMMRLIIIDLTMSIRLLTVHDDAGHQLNGIKWMAQLLQVSPKLRLIE